MFSMSMVRNFLVFRHTIGKSWSSLLPQLFEVFVPKGTFKPTELSGRIGLSVSEDSAVFEGDL